MHIVPADQPKLHIYQSAELTIQSLMNIVAANNLTLVLQTAEHAEEMFAILSDPAIYEYENEAPPSLEWLTARFTRLESRQSPDGKELWLNWVIRLPSSKLAGYVQATVLSGHRAMIAYELNSAYWGQGIARCATEAMIKELTRQYEIRQFFAVLKKLNLRSKALLDRLGFIEASETKSLECKPEPDELVMLMTTHRSINDTPLSQHGNVDTPPNSGN